MVSGPNLVPDPSGSLHLVTHVLRLAALGTHLEVKCTGESADLLVSAMRTAWSRCLSTETPDGASDTPPVDAHLDDPSGLTQRLMLTTQEITRALIGTQAGRLLMLHAGAVSHPETGASLVYVAPGGTGKTTLSQRLGRHLAYLTDETVGITDAGGILPYPKPLSVRRVEGTGLKDEVSPDRLDLVPAPMAPQVSRVVVLVRDQPPGVVHLEELTVMDALFAVVEETSSLSSLARPLHRLAALHDAAGPVLRVRYGEASDVESELAGLIGGSA